MAHALALEAFRSLGLADGSVLVLFDSVAAKAAVAMIAKTATMPATAATRRVNVIFMLSPW